MNLLIGGFFAIASCTVYFSVVFRNFILIELINVSAVISILVILFFYIYKKKESYVAVFWLGFVPTSIISSGYKLATNYIPSLKNTISGIFSSMVSITHMNYFQLLGFVFAPILILLIISYTINEKEETNQQKIKDKINSNPEEHRIVITHEKTQRDAIIGAVSRTEFMKSYPADIIKNVSFFRYWYTRFMHFSTSFNLKFYYDSVKVFKPYGNIIERFLTEGLEIGKQINQSYSYKEAYAQLVLYGFFFSFSLVMVIFSIGTISTDPKVVKYSHVLADFNGFHTLHFFLWISIFIFFIGSILYLRILLGYVTSLERFIANELGHFTSLSDIIEMHYFFCLQGYDTSTVEKAKNVLAKKRSTRSMHGGGSGGPSKQIAMRVATFLTAAVGLGGAYLIENDHNNRLSRIDKSIEYGKEIIKRAMEHRFLSEQRKCPHNMDWAIVVDEEARVQLAVLQDIRRKKYTNPTTVFKIKSFGEREELGMRILSAPDSKTMEEWSKDTKVKESSILLQESETNYIKKKMFEEVYYLNLLEKFPGIADKKTK